MVRRTQEASRALAAKLCLSILAAAAAWPAAARGGLTVSPIMVEFSPDGRTKLIEVSNPGDEPIQVQVRLFAWRTDQDGDHYDQTRDLGFNPPMFSLSPGATQVVRLAPPKDPLGKERAYRLFVDQIADPAAPGQVKMPVRMILPVFAPASTTATPRGGATLQWRLEYDDRTRSAKLIAANSGSRRVRLVDLVYSKDGRTLPIRAGLAGYVLAGQELAWSFAAPATLGSIAISANTDAGPVGVQLSFPTS